MTRPPRRARARLASRTAPHRTAPHTFLYHHHASNASLEPARPDPPRPRETRPSRPSPPPPRQPTNHSTEISKISSGHVSRQKKGPRARRSEGSPRVVTRRESSQAAVGRGGAARPRPRDARHWQASTPSEPPRRRPTRASCAKSFSPSVAREARARPASFVGRRNGTGSEGDARTHRIASSSGIAVD